MTDRDISGDELVARVTISLITRRPEPKREAPPRNPKPKREAVR